MNILKDIQSYCFPTLQINKLKATFANRKLFLEEQVFSFNEQTQRKLFLC